MKAYEILIPLLFILFSSPAFAIQPTWIVVGDSIQSLVGDGQSKDIDLSLISNERNVVFKNISSPGASLGATNAYGFNNVTTIAEFDQICGFYRYCNGFIVQAGVNDFYQNIPWSQSAAALNVIISYAQEHRKKVLMLDLIWTWNEDKPNTQGLTLLNYRDGRSRICAANPDVCIWARRPAAFDRASTSLYDSTEVAAGMQVHPNAAGHRVMANWIESAAATAGFF